MERDERSAENGDGAIRTAIERMGREDLYRILAETSPEMIYLISPDGIVRYVNTAAARMFPPRVGTVVGKRLDEIYPPAVAERHLKAIRGVLETGRTFSTELKESFPDRECWIDARLSPVKDSSGAVIGVLGLSQDITERKRADEALQRVDKLDSLSVLAGGIAHDFNNLLGGIFGYLDLARSRAAAYPEIMSYLDKALYIYDRAKGLTQQLLTFFKGGEPKRKTGRLAPVIAENATFALSGSNIKCDFRLAEDLRPCDFDENQIGQVIDNLVLNAKQAMSEGGVIVIAAENLCLPDDGPTSLPAGDYVVISFEDTGEGIPPEHLGRIFDPFFTTKASGHGLGLATSYSIVQRHGGIIEAESAPGKGSVFKVYLPASSGIVAAEPDSLAAEPARGAGTVLVMDDEAFMREVIGEMLVGLGFGFIGAKDGDEALRILNEASGRGETLAAVILDLTVPGGRGGKETIGEIRKRFPALPVFAASGFSEDPVIAKPEESGFTDSLQKPFRRSDLERLLRKR